MSFLRITQLGLAATLGAANAFLVLLGTVYLLDHVAPNYPAHESALKFFASVSWLAAVLWPVLIWVHAPAIISEMKKRSRQEPAKQA